MIKKILALVIAVMMIMSVAVIAASAEQVEIVENGVDAAADSAADAGAGSAADAGADSSASSKTIKFKTDGWNNFSQIYCHIFVYDGDSLAEWQTKAEKATDNGDGTWTYDPEAKGLSLADGTWYGVVWSADTGVETYQCLMDTSCFGDTMYMDGTKTENPVDSNKKSDTAYWTTADKSKYGPVLAVTSIGNVVGSAPPPGKSRLDLFKYLLTDKLDNARTYSGKDDQALIDDCAKALGVGKNDVEAAIAETGVTVSWSKSASTLPDDSDAGVDTKGDTSTGTGGGGSSGGSGSDSGSGSGSSSGTSGGTSGGSSGGSSGASGTASGSTKTGQETTVLFIALGVMVAAAGVIFFARKRVK